MGDEHKAFLQNDLKFHLAPNGNANKSSNADVNTVPEKHKLLFESLKGPKHSNLGRMNGQKKSAQPPLRVHKDLIDRIGSPPIAKCDTDSTMSTITAKSTQNDESENESLKVPEEEEEEERDATCKDAIVPLEGSSGSAGRKRKPQHLLEDMSSPSPNKRMRLDPTVSFDPLRMQTTPFATNLNKELKAKK